MFRTRSILIALLVLAFVVGTASAAAQEEAANRLIGADAFPELELSEDQSVDFAGNAEDPDGEFGDVQGWMRLWRDPQGGGLVAMAAEIGGDKGEAFLAGFQSTVAPEDRAQHPMYPNVVTLKTVNPLDEPTLAAIFSEGATVFILIAEGADQEALLDRALAAQLAMIDNPLVAQGAGLAESIQPESSGTSTGQLIVRLGYGVVLFLIAAWAVRRSMRARSKND